MENLIKALQIFLKYHHPERVIICEHNTLMLLLDPANVSDSDIKELETLGFKADHQSGLFESSLQGQ